MKSTLNDIDLQMEDDNPFKPLTKEQILADLDASEEDIRLGRVKDAHQAMNEIRKTLGMHLGVAN